MCDAAEGTRIRNTKTASSVSAPDDKGTSTVATTDRSDSEATEETDSEIDGHRFTVEETILIFDWDDTVLPSSWVQENGHRLDQELCVPKHIQEELADLSRLATHTLRTAQRLGTVVLVTNAERGWIELSCQKFLPDLYPALLNVKLLSARSEYERPDISSPFEWKLRAFESEIRRIFEHDRYGLRRKNILSFGDSYHEREALIHATATLRNCRTKSLKFVERPRIDELCRQHSLVARCFSRIVHHDGNLDLCIKSSCESEANVQGSKGGKGPTKVAEALSV